MTSKPTTWVVEPRPALCLYTLHRGGFAHDHNAALGRTCIASIIGAHGLLAIFLVKASAICSSALHAKL